MTNEITRFIRVHLSSEGAMVNCDLGFDWVLETFQGELVSRLEKRGVGLTWVSASERPDVRIRLVEVDQGNKLLRKLMPLIFPASLEIEGESGMSGGPSQSFHYVKKVRGGLWGYGVEDTIEKGFSSLSKKLSDMIV